MKFNIKKDILLHGLNYVSKALSSKNLIPILSGINFNLTKEGLFLSASDNNISVESFISNNDIEEIVETGNTVIQGKYILDIIRKLDDNIIKIELLDNIKFLITSGNSKFNLNCMDASEFPNLNLEEKKNPIILKIDEFKTLVNKTFFAVSTQETRPVLTGINFKISGNKLDCYATDSYRLAKKSVSLDNEVTEDINIVIPGKNLLELTKILDDNNMDIEMHVFGNKVLFKFGSTLFQTRVLSGTFPDGPRLIPKSFELEIKANTNEFYSVIDRAALLTSEKDKNIIKFECENNNLTVSSNSPEIGRVEERMTISKNNENDIQTAFSSKFMMDAIRTIDSENVILLFNGDVDPIIIKDEDDDSILQLIVPIRTY